MLDAAEKQAIEWAYGRTLNVAMAAELLGISKAQLYKLIKKHGLVEQMLKQPHKTYNRKKRAGKKTTSPTTAAKKAASAKRKSARPAVVAEPETDLRSAPTAEISTD
jgi:hypothetical protein